MSTEVEQRLAEALRGLVDFTERRPDDATADDDIRALEDAAFVLQGASPAARVQLVELLGPELSYGLGLKE